MKLYGSFTSPYVRRVRVVAAELGVSVDLVNTATDEGQAALRAVTPIWKVPVAEVDVPDGGRRVIFDSHAILDWLTAVHGFGPLRPPADPWRERNLSNAIDAALESGLELAYLRRDGLPTEGNAFADRQRARIASIFGWLEREASGGGFSPGGGLGLTELALITALDWMTFRDVYKVAAHPALVAVRAAHEGRSSLKTTLPPA
ncbi:glutathione S-transferase family protein [Sorangium sp. So ce513]|uniref:glutathione S-transferase family protein n=1 Tax=Sorangium sp. So ce513 TaxID=3133315 RepID=UPI003F6188D8